ncbi:MAG TPA: GNAT family N-acetyltransferase [Aquaticitalea sp.]|nr:GNAT family N-acetyltransferase [Aquaticitalea sp.]
MDVVFRELKENHYLFFDILSKEWQDEIVPYWNDYKASSKIYVIVENDNIIGGGIVFSIAPPDISYYKNEAQTWFGKGYLYLGFIWIAEDRRNHNLGSFWLDELKNLFPKQKYWLMIEDDRLHGFYQRNGFVLNKTICHEKHAEWLYSFKPSTL